MYVPEKFSYGKVHVMFCCFGSVSQQIRRLFEVKSILWDIAFYKIFFEGFFSGADNSFSYQIVRYLGSSD
jgi:hypothetical protein